MTRFVLYAKQRSGTGFFRSLVHAHPRVSCAPELLLNEHPKGAGYFYEHWLEAVRRDEANLAYPRCYEVLAEYLDKVLAPVGERDVIGFDVKYGQEEPLPRLFPMLVQRRVRALHLIRKNVLKTHISSFLNVNQKKLGRKAHGNSKVPVVHVAMETGPALLDALRARVDEIERYRALLASWMPVLEITYEDFLKGRSGEECINPAVLDAVFSFLGVDKGEHDLVTKRKKTNPNDLRQFVTNYQEVAATLEESPLAFCLEDDSEPVRWGVDPGFDPGMPLMAYYALHTGVRRAARLAEGGDFAPAVSALQALDGEYPGRRAVRFNLALAHEGAGDAVRSLGIYKELLKERPGDAAVAERIAALAASLRNA